MATARTPGSNRSAGPGASAPTNAIRKHGDAGLWEHTIWRDVSDEGTLVNASSATASFGYKLSGRLARAQADAAAPRRSDPMAFKDRRLRDPAATTNDPSAAGATTSPRATGHEPMPLLRQAATRRDWADDL